MTNYCHSIVETYNGYLTGIDIAYSSKLDIDGVQDVLDYNDVHSVDSELLRHALIAGTAYEIAYIDEYGVERFKVLDSREVIPVYDNTLNQELKYAIRFYKADLVNGDEYYVEVYDNKNIRTYRSSMGFKSFNLIKEEPHYFQQVPITVFDLNSDRESIFAQIMSLQDAYNELQSGEVDSWNAFADAYVVMKGVTATEEDMENAKMSRVFMIDSDADISYLTKNINDTQIQNMLVDINNNIHKIANCPDFSQESFGTTSGIALRYRLLGFENVASSIEANMRKALQKRIELITTILNLKGGDAVWRDINIQFTRNLPVNIEETSNIVNSLRGLVSDETLLSLLPFVSDPAEELERLKAQQEANMSMYSFPTGKTEEGEEVNE
jgi:SPP1 family phage portal protein